MRDPRRDSSGDKLAPKAVVGRVSLYLRQLETFQRQGQTTISSSQLGAALAIHNAQVRKDLAFFGQFGYPGIGYRIEELIPALRRILGIDRDLPLALVGLGNLGRALLRYRGFRSRGFHIVALFDNDPQKVGRTHDSLVVEPIEAMAKIVAARNVTLAVLSVPAEVAQRVADQMVACGILGIMNFAPIPLSVPPSVSVVAIDLSIQLEHLAYKVQNTQGGISYVG
ncbi:redox-sensing transcriptional repressor Rex [Singulisphaera sp. Ch08]|uniref:Redox-sensing transcriptional repressor Rex n=1 Tax=Singulisphaera sp. Ch08 TaxID=3120278 RepID=A0AAU7CA48_9BACT